MSDLPLGRKLAWLSYVALAIASVLVVISAVTAISVLAAWVTDSRGALVLAVGWGCPLAGALAAAILAFKRRIYRAWLVLGGGVLPALLLIAFFQMVSSFS